MEAFGKVHPSHRVFHQWKQMSGDEKKAQIHDVAWLYVETAKKYGHSAIFVHSDSLNYEDAAPVLEEIRNISGGEYFLMMHGDPTFSIPDGEHMTEFSSEMYEEPEKLHDQAKRSMERHEAAARRFSGSGLLDGYALCADYCFNTNPFFSGEMFDEFVVPYLRGIIAAYHDMGFYVIKHTDGNIMPIVGKMVDCGPDALHSIDPQAGVDLGEVKRMYGDKVCLIGNVNCGLLQTGTDEECAADVKRSLAQGMPGGGYIFSTSNCVYTGLPLRRYEFMLDIWKEFGLYS